MPGTPVFGKGSGGFLSTDLGTDWEWQGADGATAQEHAEAVGNDGDVVAETAHSSHMTGSEVYIYKGTIGSYNGTAGALGTCIPGERLSTAAVALTAVEINYAPCAEGKRETVQFSWSQGLAADSAKYAPSIALATKQEQTGVPALLTNTNADSECQTASYKIECQEGRNYDGTGVYLCGATYKGQETVNMTFVGVPAVAGAGWVITSQQQTTGTGSKSNTGYDTYALTAAKAVLRS